MSTKKPLFEVKILIKLKLTFIRDKIIVKI